MAINKEPYGQYARNEIFSATTTSQQISPPKIRNVLFIRNSGTSGELITLTFGETIAIANQGIVLSNGQFYVESNSEGFTTWTGPIQIIASATTAISIMER